MKNKNGVLPSDALKHLFDPDSLSFIVVDLQNDFCPGGALAVTNGDKIIPQINDLIRVMVDKGVLIVASRDWHPADSIKTNPHFVNNWPVHCIENTEGAKLHPSLIIPDIEIIISKGTSGIDDGYSAFEGKTDKGETLNEVLDIDEVNQLIVTGLATDWCVKATVLDALKRENPFTVILVEDAIAGVNINPDDSDKAIAEMLEAGAIIATTKEICDALS